MSAPEILYLFGYTRVPAVTTGLHDGFVLPNGSLLTRAPLADRTSPSGGSSFIALHSLDGRITPIVRRSGADSVGGDADWILRGDGGTSVAEPGLGAAFQLELYSHRGERVATSMREMLPEPICNGVNPDSVHISARRFIVLRNDCQGGTETRWQAERWERAGDVLERASGPYELSARALMSRFGGSPPLAFADGLGGVYWIELDPIEGGWVAVAGHFDGDNAPTYSEPLVLPGLTTEFVHARPFSGGRMLASTNYRASDGRLRTRVVLLRHAVDGTVLEPEWQWDSTDSYYSGPYNPAFDVVGEDEVLVMLINQRLRDGVYVQRLSADGVPSWPEPREVFRDDSLNLTGLETALRVVGHADGTAHLILVEDGFNGLLLPVNGEGMMTRATPRSLLPAGLGVGGYSDGRGGVWVIVNDRRGYLSHYDVADWSLYRGWSVPGCGGVTGFVTRAGPDAEPMTYFGSDPLFQ